MRWQKWGDTLPDDDSNVVLMREGHGNYELAVATWDGEDYVWLVGATHHLSSDGDLWLEIPSPNRKG